MKRPVLLLLACLLLALPTVAQAPEKAAPDDLVVTAEIVGYSYEFVSRVVKTPPRLTIHARMHLRNVTSHPRDIFMMSCEWPNSWIAKGPSGLFEPTFRPVCSRNTPTRVTIPAGEALIFDCPLLLVTSTSANARAQDSTISFKLGFMDLGFADSRYRAETSGMRISEKTNKAHAVYWSNFLSSGIDTANAQKITGNRRYFDYHLTQGGK